VLPFLPPPLPNLHSSIADAGTMVKRASTKRCCGGNASEVAGSRKKTGSCTRLKGTVKCHLLLL
jgi:hypothetical protein